MNTAKNDLAADVAGDWELHFKGPMGPETWNMKITQDGDNLKIQAKSPFLGSFESKGTVKDDAIHMEFVHRLPQGIFNREFNGTVEGNAMKGESKLNGSRESDFDAAKK